jgi:hypothetical protein
MNERRWERLGAEAGIAFVVLGVIATFAPGSQPDQDASGRQLVTYIADHHDGLMWSMVLWSLATVCGLFFLAALRSRMARAEGGHNEMATAVVIGGTFAFLANWIGGMVVASVSYRESIGVAPATVRAMWDVGNLGAIVANIGGVVFAGSVAAVVLGTGLLPRWVGWFAAAVSVGSVASLFGPLSSTGALAPGGGYQIVMMMAGLVLVGAVAVECLMHAEAPASAPSAAPMTV